MIPKELRHAAMPQCLKEDCEQPWLRVEYASKKVGDRWVQYASAVCESGHRVRVDPVDQEASS